MSRKIIFNMMISIDGFYKGPNDELDRHLVDEEFNEYAIGFLNSLDVLIFGRKNYELMTGYWPTAKVLIKGDDLVAERMNNLQKMVFSKTLQKVGNDSMLYREVNPEEMMKLKNQPGKDFWVGGSDLALTFIKHNLIDEYHMIVVPVVLGSGKRLFEGLNKRLNLKLMSTKTFKSGNLLHCYQPV